MVKFLRMLCTKIAIADGVFVVLVPVVDVVVVDVVFVDVVVVDVVVVDVVVVVFSRNKIIN